MRTAMRAIELRWAASAGRCCATKVTRSVRTDARRFVANGPENGGFCGGRVDGRPERWDWRASVSGNTKNIVYIIRIFTNDVKINSNLVLYYLIKRLL